jgi:hypothetical protein
MKIPLFGRGYSVCKRNSITPSARNVDCVRHEDVGNRREMPGKPTKGGQFVARKQHFESAANTTIVPAGQGFRAAQSRPDLS